MRGGLRDQGNCFAGGPHVVLVPKGSKRSISWCTACKMLRAVAGKAAIDTVS